MIREGLPDDCSTGLLTNSEDVKRYIWALASEEHDYRTAVLDSADWLEQIIHREVVESCEDSSAESIADLPFGKGYEKATSRFTSILDGLSLIRDKGINVCITAHSRILTIEPPGKMSYSKYAPKLHVNAKGVGAGALIHEWADEVLFCNYKELFKTEEQGFGRERRVGVGTGQRVMYTTETPSHVAKNRLGLPEEMLLDADLYLTYLEKRTVSA